MDLNKYSLHIVITYKHLIWVAYSW